MSGKGPEIANRNELPLYALLIKKRRLTHDMTQLALAHALGKKGVNTVSQYERGLARPHYKTAVLLAKVLGGHAHEYLED